MLRHSTRRSLLPKLGVLAAICALLATQAVSFYHDTFIRHRLCQDHNELVHESVFSAKQLTASGDQTRVERRSESGHSRDSHTHCLFHGTSGAKGSPLHELALIHRDEVGSKLIFLASVRATGPPQVAHILQAPKTSPPA